MSYFVYQIIAWTIFLIVFPFFLIYSLGGGRQELWQRLGLYRATPRKPDGRPRIWLHAASVGEVQVARALVRELGRQLPEAEIWVSTLTRQGLQVCREQMPDGVHCLFAPLDLAGICSRMMRNIGPDLYVCLETELWPEIIRQAARHQAGPALLNARLSERSLRRYRRWPAASLIMATISRFRVIAAIGEDDARRYRELGADPAAVVISGNAKYDLTPVAAGKPCSTPATRIELEGGLNSLCSQLGIGPEQPVLVCGSTHHGEEELLLTAWRKLKRNLPGLVWVIAPRHLRRLPEIEAMFRGRNLEYWRLSELSSGAAAGGAARTENQRATVILVDQMGKLAELYAVADYVFCGGSLVQRGGHNLLEAAAHGKPVLFGPHMDDFREDAELLRQGGGGFLVRDEEELCQRIMAFHTRPAEYHRAAEQAGGIARRLRGAARQQVEIIKQLIDQNVGKNNSRGQ
ncbi:3-deoxy-D-manno-octulosonic acid transferase [Desulfurivibrio sp. D14AmB]|uniref:3-deoxy-D-manno-octulosonic acid transferase n=1 Tax=Desulfurivibrio sp. D14AmB TaxID=3374370 RepID=UPI00376EF7A1